LTILGLGASVYDYINLAHRDCANLGEVWTINAGGVLFRHDVLFDMHTEAWIYGLKASILERVLSRRRRLKTHDKPIYMPQALPDYPTSVTYPLADVIEKTGSCYFSAGLAYLLAMAYCCNVRRLSMWGCDFSYDRDTNSHDEQGRACCEYWVGRLVGIGCAVSHSASTHFMDSRRRSAGRIYGYDEPVRFDFPIEGGKGKFVGPDYL
jgi:hypothetical protein